MKTSLYLITFIITILFMSCGQEKYAKSCSISYDTTFKETRDPLFYIEKFIGNCQYQGEITLWTRDATNPFYKTVIQKKDSAFFLKSGEPESEFIKLFDFQAIVGKITRIEVTFKDGTKGFVEVVLEEKYTHRLDEIIYQFKIPEGFLGGENFPRIDEVIFISSKRGPIGSYLTKIEDEQKMIFYPSGDILEEIIDYSDYEEWELCFSD